jgi:small subunit ribosomal protein S4e
MVKKHLKTLTVPRTWPIKRKSNKFVVRPNPGKPFNLSIPLALVFKNMLKYCKTTKEVKNILHDKEVFVDSIRRVNHKYLLGFMDILSIPLADEYYRMILSKNKRLKLMKISKEESKIKLSKIIGKTVLKKGKLQLNLFDGRNILVKEDKYKIGDSLLIELPNKIKDSFKLEKGAYAFLVGGNNAGEHGKIDKISNRIVTIKSKEMKFETSKEFVFVIGKEKSSIKLD